MNCEACKFRLAAVSEDSTNSHHHHGHDHHHHDHNTVDPYAKLEDYHQQIWQVP